MRASIVIPTFNRLDQLQVRRQSSQSQTSTAGHRSGDRGCRRRFFGRDLRLVGIPGRKARFQGDSSGELGTGESPQPGSRGRLRGSHRLSRRRHRTPARLAQRASRGTSVIRRSRTTGGSRLHLLLTRYREPLSAFHQRIWRPVRVLVDRRSPCGALQFLLHVKYFPATQRACQVGRVSRGLPGGGLGRYRVCLSCGRGRFDDSLSAARRGQFTITVFGRGRFVAGRGHRGVRRRFSQTPP